MNISRLSITETYQEPHLRRLVRRSEDDQVFAVILRHLAVDLPAHGVGRQRVALQKHQPALLRHPAQGEVLSGHRHRERRAAQVIPAQFLDKERLEREFGDVAADAGGVWGHGSDSLAIVSTS
jgi:hypothetical protein